MIKRAIVIGIAAFVVLAGAPFIGATTTSRPPLFGIGGCFPDCNFDSVGLLNQLGTEVTVSGPFSCPAQEGVWEMQISVAQESTLAAARGIGNGVCQGEIRTFVVSAVTRDGTPVFVDGTALVCALFVRGHGADIGRVAHWCNFIRLQH